jgi:sulfotransferase family protein
MPTHGRLPPLVQICTRGWWLLENALPPLRHASSELRALPDALIIGAQRSGTSSLVRHLARHPGVLKSLGRGEIHFFDRDPIFARGVSWYRSRFPLRSMVRLVGSRLGCAPRVLEKTPAYLFRPKATERMAELLPDARLIVLLRNPVERAYSNYHHARRELGVTMSFEEVVETGIAAVERDGVDAVAEAPGPATVVARSVYHDQLARLFKLYPRERVHVERSESYFARPDESVDRLLDFLGLPRMRLTVKAVRPPPYARLPEALRRRLTGFFRPHNDRLERLLGRAMEWDATEAPA